MRRYQKIILAMTFVTSFMLVGITLLNPISANGQSKGKMALTQGIGRDPFSLPSGIRLLSKTVPPQITHRTPPQLETKTTEVPPTPLMVKAILISDHIRLASINRHIVTVGDSILDERVLEIHADRVILGKGDKKRILLLSQSPIRLTVEER
ncbi:MAG: hypothetical protein AB1502_12955 [Thermodesulfobacteriota bacterium]